MSCNATLDCLDAAIGAMFADTLEDRCTIKRAVLTYNGRGEYISTLMDLATDVPCLLAATRWRATEFDNAGKTTGVTLWDIYLPPGTDVSAATDKIVITSLSNRTFEVTGMRSGSTEILRMINAIEVL